MKPKYIDWIPDNPICELCGLEQVSDVDDVLCEICAPKK